MPFSLYNEFILAAVYTSAYIKAIIIKKLL